MIKRLFNKIRYWILVIYYAITRSSMPLKHKLLLWLAIFYFIFPFDFLSDLMPLIGFADDITLLIAVYRIIRKHIDFRQARELAAKHLNTANAHG